MSRTALSHVLGKASPARAIVTALATAVGTRMTVADASGSLLHGEAAVPGGLRFPVTVDGQELGAVLGTSSLQPIANLIQHLAEKQAEHKSLGAEVLHLYREVNLIYSFSEKLAALLDLRRVVDLTLQEARHLIVASDGAVLLADEDTGALTTWAAFGDELSQIPGIAHGHGIVGAVAANGIAEIVNDVRGDRRRVTNLDLQSLVCAPLKVGERVIGVVLLASTVPMAYAARELKLLSTLALQAATAIENARLFERTVEAARERERLMALNKQAEVARAGYERELDLAARIQADLFPARLPDLAGYQMAARSRAARRCGGDYYDVLKASGDIGDARYLLCVADVSGKGLPASLLMSHTQATLRALLGRAESLTDLAASASALLHASTAENKYVTAALLALDPTTGMADYVSAGHINSLLVSRDGRVLALSSTGAPLGLLPPGPAYGSTRVELAPGDCLVCCSDGVTDAQNEAGEEFGEDRLTAILTSALHDDADGLVSRVFDAIDAFAAETPQFDDITLLVLRRL